MIGLLQASAIHRRVYLRRLWRSRLRFTAVALALLPVVAAGAALPFDRAPFENVLELFFRFLFPFLPALGASTLVAEEVDQKTFTFLFARPAPRSSIVLGKYTAVVLPTAALLLLSLGATFLVSSLRGTVGDLIALLPRLGRAGAAALLAAVVFAALAALLGAWFTRHPFLAAVGYLISVEWMFGFVPLLKLGTLTFHLRKLADQRPTTVFLDGDLAVPWWASVGALLLLGGLALLGAATSVAHAEYRTDR